MISINGSIQLVPGTVQTESGTLRVDEENTQPAVLQTLVTLSGPVQVIYPAESIDGIIEGLKKAKEEALKERTTTDLYIPSSMDEADNMAKAQEEILTGGNDEAKGSQ